MRKWRTPQRERRPWQLKERPDEHDRPRTPQVVRTRSVGRVGQVETKADESASGQRGLPSHKSWDSRVAFVRSRVEGPRFLFPREASVSQKLGPGKEGGADPVIKRIKPRSVVPMFPSERILDPIHEPRPNRISMPNKRKSLRRPRVSKPRSARVKKRTELTGRFRRMSAQKDARSGHETVRGERSGRSRRRLLGVCWRMVLRGEDMVVGRQGARAKICCVDLPPRRRGTALRARACAARRCGVFEESGAWGSWGEGEVDRRWGRR